MDIMRQSVNLVVHVHPIRAYSYGGSGLRLNDGPGVKL